MNELIRIWGDMRKYEEFSTNVPDTFLEALKKAFQEAYSEGHCDGQNAADDEDPEEYPRDTGKAWERSHTLRDLAKLT